MLFRSAMARKILLVLAAREPDTLLGELPGFELVHARTPDAAEALLRDLPVSLAIAFPEATATAVEQLVQAVARTRRGTPVLAIRDRDEPGWTGLGIGVLRRPLLPG